MAQENQGKNLEDRLLEIATLNQIGKEISNTRKPSENIQLYSQLAGILSQGNDEDYKNIYGDIRVSPEEGVRYSTEGTRTRAKDIEPIYKENKNKIIENVISLMNKNIKDSKNKSEAATILSNYFQYLIDLPELEQTELDELAQKDLAKRIGVSMNFTAKGSQEKYKELQYRMLASQYLKEKTINGNISYSVDEDKLKKTMENVMPGAIIYRNAFGIEEELKKQEETKKKVS